MRKFRELGGRKGDCSVDFKLGDFGDFRLSKKWPSIEATVEMVSSSSLGSLRRTHGSGSGGPLVSCLVEGCASDLSQCREYHRRHKVCEVHSKSAMVMVGGREQRFCQQCSRFHLLVEFDEVKRSCRKRLEGHNRRRRKPPLNAINSRSFATSYQGSRFIPYPHTFSLTTPKSSWSTVIKEEEAPAYTSSSSLDLLGVHSNYEHFPVSSCGSFKIGKQFPFLQESAEASIGSMSPPLLKSRSAAAEPSHCSKLYDSNCALSLLSLPAARSTSVNNLGQATDSGDTIPIGQPLIPAMRFNGSQGAFNNNSNTVSSTGFSYSGLEHKHLGTVLISDSNDIFQVGVEGSSDCSQTLSFSWQ